MTKRRGTRRALSVLVGIIVGMASVGVSPSLASASEGVEPPPEANAAGAAATTPGVTAEGNALSGIGQGVRVWTGNVPIYQCPWTFCNYGLAQTSHDVALICSWNPIMRAPSGNPWFLVLDRGVNENYNVVGFVDSYWVDAYTMSYRPPDCLDTAHTWRIVQSSWFGYQCPASYCNRSSEWIAGDYVWTYCGTMTGWKLSVNMSRTLYQAGFVRVGWDSPMPC